SVKRNGPHEIEPVGQFVELFPDARHNISHYTGQMGPSQWSSEIGIHERYVLTVYLDVELDWSRHHIRSYGQPKYVLCEIISVTGPAGGPYRAGYEPSSERRFGAEEWRKLYESRGDLRVLGIEPVTDQPVPNFNKALLR